VTGTDRRAAATDHDRATDHDPVVELRRAGLSATTARRTVLTALHGHIRPASAAEVHAQLRRDGHRVGLTTVYRTLHALAAAGLVHVFHVDGEDTYRHCRYGPHHHLICQRCRMVIERPTGELDALLDRVLAEADFVPDPQQADLVGTCGACRRTAVSH
jgi:Fur family ferric uptake transcriptional regulator